MTNRSEDEPAELSSPACSMSEADDTYMGYAGRAELVGFLNELLEAERAGARVTLKSAREAGAGPVAKLLWTIQRDEARWCAMLIRPIKTLGESNAWSSSLSEREQLPDTHAIPALSR
jgi:hypothetical protein